MTILTALSYLCHLYVNVNLVVREVNQKGSVIKSVTKEQNMYIFFRNHLVALNYNFQSGSWSLKINMDFFNKGENHMQIFNGMSVLEQVAHMWS